jgi:predicted short-subunit dehydrogenase-like oxidoreductase (DUF2520 family)
VKSADQWNITLVGAGNVAWHMGKALSQKGYVIKQVLDRTASSSKQLAEELNAESSGTPESGIAGTDCCLICVSDDAIASVIEQLKPGNCLLIHTAGSVSLDVFRNRAVNFGVLYPLQTFTRGRPLDYSRIPFLTEANTPENLSRINQIASSVSHCVMEADSSRRLFIHLAAIFASNFSNHMYALAEKLAGEYNMPFDLLKPLIAETAAKAMDMSPQKAQTGPAARGNMIVIEKHLELLKDHPAMQELYRMISESIKTVKLHFLPTDNP